ncbi:MAG: hypothetical protein ACRD5H_00235 [Nitrososphaerales archaeon]
MVIRTARLMDLTPLERKMLQWLDQEGKTFRPMTYQWLETFINEQLELEEINNIELRHLVCLHRLSANIPFYRPLLGNKKIVDLVLHKGHVTIYAMTLDNGQSFYVIYDPKTGIVKEWYDKTLMSLTLLYPTLADVELIRRVREIKKEARREVGTRLRNIIEI